LKLNTDNKLSLIIIIISSKLVECSSPQNDFLDQNIAVGAFDYDLFDGGFVIPVQGELSGVEGGSDTLFVLLEEFYYVAITL
jgi:hypothetical protein